MMKEQFRVGLTPKSDERSRITKPSLTPLLLGKSMQNIHRGSEKRGDLHLQQDSGKINSCRREWGRCRRERGPHEYKIIRARCLLLVLLGRRSTFITLPHQVWVLSVFLQHPPSSSSSSYPPPFLVASRTLKSLRGAAASRSNESVCCHFSDAGCEIKRAVYVRAVAGIKRRAHIRRRQLLQSLQAHIYVPFVQFTIWSTKPIF